MAERGRPTIPPELLICAYLGRRFRDAAKDPASPAYRSFEAQAEELGTSKQNVLKLKNGGTVGTGMLFHFAERITGGSIDELRRKAGVWYRGLSDAEQETVSRWAAENDRMVRDNVEVARRAAREAESVASGADEAPRSRRGKGPGVRGTR